MKKTHFLLKPVCEIEVIEANGDSHTFGPYDVRYGQQMADWHRRVVEQEEIQTYGSAQGAVFARVVEIR
jgi:hypothetical protein